MPPKTVHEVQLGLRRFYRFLVQEGEVASDPTQGMKLARYRVDPQPTYTEAEVKRLLLVCNVKARAGLRDVRRLPPDGTRNRAASAILPLDAHMFPEDSRPGRPSDVAAPVGRGEVPPWLHAQVAEGRAGCLAV